MFQVYVDGWVKFYYDWLLYSRTNTIYNRLWLYSGCVQQSQSWVVQSSKDLGVSISFDTDSDSDADCGVQAVQLFKVETVV